MQLITNRIQTGKPGRFEDFVRKFKEEQQIKTASVKVAEEKDEADSSGQLDVEPLHQEGESTTMPKAGPSAKKDDGEKSAAADTNPEEEGKDSGQPRAEGSEKFTNNVKFDPNDSSDEEKGIDASAKTTVKVAMTCDNCGQTKEDCNCVGGFFDSGKDKKASATCEKCKADPCECEGTCDCTACIANREVKEAKGTVPESFKEHQFKAKGDDGEKEEEKEAKDEDKNKEEKEAGSKCGKCDCDPCECDKTAAAALNFVKWANLDSKNKSFLTKYWRQLFGDDYVNALVADK